MKVKLRSIPVDVMIYNWWMFHIYRLLLGVNTGNGMKWCMILVLTGTWEFQLQNPLTLALSIYIYIQWEFQDAKMEVRKRTMFLAI